MNSRTMNASPSGRSSRINHVACRVWMTAVSATTDFGSCDPVHHGATCRRALALYDLLQSPALRAARIGKEQLLAPDVIGGDRPLALRPDEPIHEGLPFPRLHVGMLFRIHQHHPVLIEKSAFPPR